MRRVFEKIRPSFRKIDLQPFEPVLKDLVRCILAEFPQGQRPVLLMIDQVIEHQPDPWRDLTIAAICLKVID